MTHMLVSNFLLLTCNWEDSYISSYRDFLWQEFIRTMVILWSLAMEDSTKCEQQYVASYIYHYLSLTIQNFCFLSFIELYFFGFCSNLCIFSSDMWHGCDCQISQCHSCCPRTGQNLLLGRSKVCSIISAAFSWILTYQNCFVILR